MCARFNVMNISRHRMCTDSKGISTLVTLYGCPLKCEYCINDYCHDENTNTYILSGEELADILRIDDMYFRMSNGGITFGGGEPLLYADDILDFVLWDMPEGWKVTIETSLNVEWDKVECLAEIVDYWIIDIKDMNPEIYERYTKMGNEKVIYNLKKLSSIIGKEKIKVRVPNIPGYNTENDVVRSKEIVEGLAGEVEVFLYRK